MPHLSRVGENGRPFRSMRSLAVVVAASLFAALLPACDRARIEGIAAKPIERPTLRAVNDTAPVEPSPPWITLEPADQNRAAHAPVTVQAEGSLLMPDPHGPGGPGLLRIFGPERKSLRFAIPNDSKRVDRVRLRLWITRFDVLGVSWLRDDVQLGETFIPLFPDPSPADYTVEVPSNFDRQLDELLLFVPGGGPVGIGRVELLELAGRDHLPRAGEPAAFVSVGDDVRPASGITPLDPAVIEFDAPPDGILVASAAVPRHMLVVGDRPILSVQIEGEPGGLRVHRYPLADGDNSMNAWVPIRVPLDSAGPGKTRVEFHLESNSPKLAACALTQPQVVRFDESAPTVLLVTSDTHRADHTGFAHGGAPVKTPVIDALAERGVAFDNAWSATNVTIASHAAMFTGLTLRETRLVDNNQALAAEARTLAEAFSEAGWATVAAVSASHLDADWSGLGQGFDRMAVSLQGKRTAGETLAHLERWVPDYRGRPLFVWLHLFDAHTPYAPPLPFRTSAWDTTKDPFDPRLPEPPPGTVPTHLAGVRDLDYVVAQYRGEVNYLDSELGRLLERTRFRDAIVAFTADHGESFGSHGVFWDHGGLYRDRLHVPLVLRWPGAPAGTRVERNVSNTDVGRTLLDLAGLEDIEHAGSNLVALSESTAVEEPVFAISCFAVSAAIVDGDDLLILQLREHQLHEGADAVRLLQHAVELYDMARDPECANESSSARPERAAELRARLIQWLQARESSGLRRAPVGSVEVLKNLSALGYAQGMEGEADGAFFPIGCDCAECAKYTRGS